jgi:hypothetical protein
MAKTATKKKPSIDALVDKALDQGFTETKEIMAAVQKARPNVPDNSVQSRISAVKKRRGLGRSKKGSAGSVAVDTEAVMLFILKQGSVEKAKANIAKIKDDPVISFAIAAGGIKAAQDAIKVVESKLDHVPF